MAEFAVATGDQALYRSEDIQLGEGGAQNQDRLWLQAWARGSTAPRGAGRGGSACSLPTPDYKNNILKERAELAHSPLPAKYIDLDKGEWLGGRGWYLTSPTLTSQHPPPGGGAGVPGRSCWMSALCLPHLSPLASRVQEGVLQIR